MPKLKEWTEDKLKRGYKKRDIKNYLSRRGYSPEAVAEVDKTSFNLKKKRLSAKIVLIALAIIILLWIVNIYIPLSSQEVSEPIVAEPEQALPTIVEPANGGGIEPVAPVAVAPPIEGGSGVPATQPVQAVQPAQPAAVGQFQELCSKYHEVKSEISCEDAVRIALIEEPGTVKNVSLGPVHVIDFSTAPYTTKDEIHWLIDIELAESRFDSFFKKELTYLRVGIGLKENGIYREPIK